MAGTASRSKNDCAFSNSPGRRNSIPIYDRFRYSNRRPDKLLLSVIKAKNSHLFLDTMSLDLDQFNDNNIGIDGMALPGDTQNNGQTSS